MNTNKNAKILANELGLSTAESVVMELKASLYFQASRCIKKSSLTHDEIANLLGTSRARITRIANMGENSISLELLIKIIVTLENKVPFKVA